MKKSLFRPLSFGILLSLWMSLIAANLSAQEYNYSYMPKMGSYTSTGSGTDEYPAIDYRNECLDGDMDTYTLGQIKATVTRHTSTRITFNISKSSGYFRNGNSGKIFIHESYYGDVYATSFSISNSTTSTVTAYLSNYEDFEGTRTFDVYLITSDQIYKQYGGTITITGTRNVMPPTVQTGSVSASAHSATFTGKVNPNGNYTEYYFKYGTDVSYMETSDVETLPSSYGETSVRITVDGLTSNSHYYYEIVAENEGGKTGGKLKEFDTESAANNPPTIPTNLSPAHGAKDVPVTGYFSWRTSDPEGDDISYVVYLGTSESNMKIYDAGIGSNRCHYELEPGMKYYWRVQVSDGNQSAESTYYYFTTIGSGSSGGSSGGSSDGTFADCTSAEDCGNTNYGGQIYQAASYLAQLGVVEGDNGYLRPDANVTRAQLAKMSLYSLYKGESKVPSDLVSDNFPSIYPDLQNSSDYYYRPAKALLYLEYQDGVSPFDRNRSHFSPEGAIERNLVLKVICETFNIKPAESSSSNPFNDFLPSENCWGYAKKCYDLGIVQTTSFRPFDYCTRGEVMLYLYRILTSGRVSIPTPVNSENASNSSFFIPANLTAKTMGRKKGLETGNFNFYQKDFFQISGYMPLDFGVTYNSYLTEMPTDLYPLSPVGTAWSHSYNVYMNIIADSDNGNRVLVFHTADGSLLMYDAKTRQPMTDGNYLTLTKVGSNYVLTSIDKTSYTFERYSTTDGIYYLTQVSDRNGNTKTIAYEDGENHRRVTFVKTMNRKLNFSYASGTDRVSCVTDPMGRKVYFTYDEDNLATIKDAKNQTTSFSYGTTINEKGLLMTITLPRGNTVTNEYQQRKLTSTRYNNDTPTAITIDTDYANGELSSTVEQPVNGNQTITTHLKMDENGRTTSVTDYNKTDVAMTYNDSDNPTLPTRITDRKTGITTNITYNEKGQVKRSVSAAGGNFITNSYTYDTDYNLTSHTDPNGNTTYYSYSNGNLTSVTDAMGHVTNITNNSNGKPIEVTDPAGKKVSISYNSFGNLTQTSIPALDVTTTYGYDPVSRLTSIRNANGKTSSYEYDDNDNLVTATDNMGYNTHYTYDANDNLTVIRNAKGGETTLTYDSNDLLARQSFQGYDKRFNYNTDGSLASSTSPNGDTRYYSYDESGFITENDYASFSYNSKGWLDSVEKDGKSIEYGYDALGRVTMVEYDGQEVEYDYDNNGNVTTITYPGGKDVNYNYDALNRVTSVTDWNDATTYFEYNDDGTIDYVQLPNKVRTTYSYDNAGRLIAKSTRRNSGNGTFIAEYNYGLDNHGNHLTENISEPYNGIPIPAEGTKSFSYNDANRITKAGSISFGYDNNGNTTSRTGRSMTYDIVNNLTGISGDFTASYTYDGLGQRRSATRGGTTTKYVLSGKNVVAETNASGNVKYYYIYGPTGLLARITPSGTTRYYVSDIRGSVLAMTDATTNAEVTHKYQYDVFGQVLQSQEEDTNLFRFVGCHGVMHEDDNLTFMRARYYDPTIGRFLSEDPIWNTNLYPYAEDNPIMGIDPNGTYSLPVVGEDENCQKNYKGNASYLVYEESKSLFGVMVPKCGDKNAYLRYKYYTSQGHITLKNGETYPYYGDAPLINLFSEKTPQQQYNESVNETNNTKKNKNSGPYYISEHGLSVEFPYKTK